MLGADLVFTNAPGARGNLLIDHTRQNIRPRLHPRIGRDEAIEAAVRKLGIGVYRARPRAGLAILPRPPHGLLVWRVVLPSRVPLGTFEVLVNARTSRVLLVQDLLRFDTGQAAIFDPNPVETQRSRNGLDDSNDTDSPLLNNLRTSVTLRRLNPLDNCLDGQWVRAVLPPGDPAASTPQGDVCLPGRDWGLTGANVTRSDHRFEALMAYFHIDRNEAYIQSLGLTNVVNRQLQMNVDDTSSFPPGGDDNSFYDPATGQITLGAGGVDDGEDADVMNHEYGHAIQDSQVPGFGQGQEAGAMGEGFADYFAAVMSAMYTPTPEFDPCIGEWDVLGLIPPLDCLRSVDLNPTVAQMRQPPCGSEIHCLGQAWSGALWTIRGTIGEPAADKLIIQSQFSLTPSASFQDGSVALLAADQALNGGANQAFLRNLLSSRGLVDLERIDDTLTTAVPLAVPGQVTGSIDSASDPHDVYRLQLSASHRVIVHSTSAADIDLRLYAPGSASLHSGTIVAGSTRAGTGTESFAHIPTTSGAYFLDIAGAGGSGAYTIETISDADADGLADASDNCPTVSNRSQADWNRNGKGDACDPSAKVTVKSVSARKHVVSFLAQVQPASVPPRAWRLLYQRRTCTPRCHYGSTRSASGTRKVAPGRIQLTFRVALPGLYRLQAVLTDPHFDKVKSRFAAVRVLGPQKKPAPASRRRK